MQQRIKSYVIRNARMSKGQKQAYETLYDKYCIPFQESLYNFQQHSKDKALFVEIGFGMGDATAEIAAHFPENYYLGIEVHKPGIGKLMAMAEKAELKNLSIIHHDAVEVCEKMIEKESVDGFHIFFPDPWQKAKHHKRRIIQIDFINMLLPLLKKEGYIYTVTDWEDYAHHMLDVFSQIKGIKSGSKSFFEGTDWRPTTKFEQKGINKNHQIYELLYTKL